MKPDCKWNIKYGRKASKVPRDKQPSNNKIVQAKWMKDIKSELVDLEKAFKIISIKGMKKSFNKRYVKQHGNVKATNNYLRNVILGKDGEPKRFVRPGDGEPLYIMENGKPIRRNTSNHNSKRHQIKNNLKIPTQQQWNNMIKKRHCKRRLREIKRNDTSYH